MIVADSYHALAEAEAEMMTESKDAGLSVEFVGSGESADNLMRVYRRSV